MHDKINGIEKKQFLRTYDIMICSEKQNSCIHNNFISSGLALHSFLIIP